MGKTYTRQFFKNAQIALIHQRFQKHTCAFFPQIALETILLSIRTSLIILCHWNYLAIRLTNSDGDRGNISNYYGFVEIYRYEKWWKLSDEDWSNTDANVVCRYLGYDRASEIFTKTLSTTNETVLSANFICHGNEGELSDCIQKEQKPSASFGSVISGVRCIVDGKTLSDIWIYVDYS